MNSDLNTVYVIDDDIKMCKAIKWLLEPANLKVLEYNNAQDFLNVYQTTMRGCLLIDVRMPGISGLQLQEKLIDLGNTMPIIIISAHGDIAMAVRALKAGAVDFITKPFNDQSLLEQIQNALSSDKEQSSIQELRKLYSALTSREQEITSKIVEGKMNKEIAYELEISIKTVETHRAHIMQKMKVKSLAELIRGYCSLEMDKGLK